MIANHKEIVGNGEFFFSPNSRSLTEARANGWIQFKNLAVAKLKPLIEANEHTMPCRGVNTRGKTNVREIGLQLMLEAHDVDFQTLAVALGSSSKQGGKQEDGTNQASGTCASITVDQNNYQEIWHPIKTTGGVHLKNITSASFDSGGAISPDDYDLDKRNGLVRFLRNLTIPATVTPTCAADGFNSAARLTGDVAVRAVRKSGLGCLAVFGQHGDDATGDSYAQIIYNDFSCDIAIDGSVDIDPATASTISLQVDITDLPGTVEIRE